MFLKDWTILYCLGVGGMVHPLICAGVGGWVFYYFVMSTSFTLYEVIWDTFMLHNRLCYYEPGRQYNYLNSKRVCS